MVFSFFQNQNINGWKAINIEQAIFLLTFFLTKLIRALPSGQKFTVITFLYLKSHSLSKKFHNFNALGRCMLVWRWLVLDL